MKKKYTLLFSFMLFFMGLNAQETPTVEIKNTIVELKIKPSATDSTIVATDVAHWVRYDSTKLKNKLFLFLPGTNGIPVRGPKKLFDTAIELGYPVINLSYINQPAVARICRGENLIADAKCAEKFRTQRVFGTQVTPLIQDEPQDAIVPRLTKLLQYLVKFDKKGNWNNYLENGAPKWNEIIVTGQSQGGGMAAFIAKKKLVHRMISFSGGWDYAAKNKIAGWYANESITPAERWFGTYHAEEPKAETIDASYVAMEIPKDQIFRLTKKVREGRRAHGEAIRNTTYKELWVKLLTTASN